MDRPAKASFSATGTGCSCQNMACILEAPSLQRTATESPRPREDGCHPRDQREVRPYRTLVRSHLCRLRTFRPPKNHRPRPRQQLRRLARKRGQRWTTNNVAQMDSVDALATAALNLRIGRAPTPNVIVVSCNEGSNLGRTIDNLSTTHPPACEIVVVDDNSIDEAQLRSTGDLEST